MSDYLQAETEYKNMLSCPKKSLHFFCYNPAKALHFCFRPAMGLQFLANVNIFSDFFYFCAVK